ncbi:MAG: hypothetical protein RIB47_11125 [Cyclobacteriaceae bacterium]
MDQNKSYDQFHLLLNCLLSLLVLAPRLSLAQQTGEVDYPYLGIKFTIPNNWKGAEAEGGFLIASDTEPGLIFLLPHEVKDIELLKQEAEAGVKEEGIMLSKISEFEAVGQEGVGAEFEGMIQGEAAKAFVAAVINPFGSGVTILAAAASKSYSAHYKQLAKEIAMSLQFSEPVEPPVTQEWRNTLSGAKLTYLNSSYDSGPSYGGYSTYSSYSSRNEITLCPTGLFSYYSSSSMSVDTGGAFAGNAGNIDGRGKWSVTANAEGVPVLRLDFANGEVYSYKLTYENKKTYLNGSRYFRTYDDVQCN